MFKLSHKYNQHSASLYALAYSPQQDLLFTGGGDKIIASWDLNQQENTPFSIKTKSAILNLQFINNYSQLFLGLFNGDFHIIDTTTRKEIKYFPYHKGGVFSSCYIESKNLLFVGAGDGTLSIWNSFNFELLQNYKICEGKIRAIHQEGDNIYIGTSDGEILMIHINKLSEAVKLHTIEESIYCISFHKEKNALILGDKNAHLQFFSLNENKIILSIAAHNWPIYAITWIDGQTFATCSRDKIIKIWNANTLEVVQRLSFPDHKGHLNSINNLIYIDEKSLLVSVGDDKQICVWEKTN